MYKEMGAIDIRINVGKVKIKGENSYSDEYEGLSKEEIENKVMEENMEKFSKEHLNITDKLKGETGIKLGKNLLRILSSKKVKKENKKDYENRIMVH